jgi:hypothetical protein
MNSTTKALESDSNVVDVVRDRFDSAACDLTAAD